MNKMHKLNERRKWWRLYVMDLPSVKGNFNNNNYDDDDDDNDNNNSNLIIIIIVAASGSLYLSGACSAATVTSFGPNNSLHPSTASSRAKQSAIIGPLQTSNMTISSEWRLGAWSIEGPPTLAANPWTEQCPLD